MIRRKAAKWAVVAAQRKDEGSPAIELPGEAADEYDDEDCAVVVRKVTAWSFEELPDLLPKKNRVGAVHVCIVVCCGPKELSVQKKDQMQYNGLNLTTSLPHIAPACTAHPRVAAFS